MPRLPAYTYLTPGAYLTYHTESKKEQQRNIQEPERSSKQIRISLFPFYQCPTPPATQALKFGSSGGGKNPPSA